MKIVYKYPVESWSEIKQLHEGYEVVAVAEQFGVPTVWISQDTSKIMVPVVFSRIATGEYYDEHSREIVGTAFCQGLVWHVCLSK